MLAGDILELNLKSQTATAPTYGTSTVLHSVNGSYNPKIAANFFINLWYVVRISTLLSTNTYLTQQY